MSKKMSISNPNKSEEQYFVERKKLLEGITSHEVADAPFVYSDRQMLSESLTRIDLFKKVIEIQGSIVECGVHKGNNLFLFNHLSTILEPFNFNRKIIGFDTFEGFRSLSEKDDGRLTNDDFSDTNLEILRKFSSIESLNRAVSHIQKIELVKGDATETIPKYVEDNPHLIIALLYLDFDIYEPTKTALDFLLPLVPKGGVVGLDEINCKKWAGETVALKETLSLASVKLRKFSYSPWVSYFIVE